MDNTSLKLCYTLLPHASLVHSGTHTFVSDVLHTVLPFSNNANRPLEGHITVSGIETPNNMYSQRHVTYKQAAMLLERGIVLRISGNPNAFRQQDANVYYR